MCLTSDLLRYNKKVQVSKLRGKPRHETRSTEGVTECRDIPSNKGLI
jgi:hypothetical protein